jgi:hypothetical protein
MEELLDKARRFLQELGRYGDLAKQTEPSRTFEILFAYFFELEGVRLQYEASLKEDDSKKVDFLYQTESEKKLGFELYRPEQSDPIKEEIKQRTDSFGYTLELSSRDERKHLRPEAQTVRLQEKLISKVDKFPTPTDEVFSVIVVDCTEVQLGMFDIKDARMVMYGRTRNPAFQDWWEDQRVSGLCEDNHPHQSAPEFRKRVSAVIFVRNSQTFFDEAYATLNIRRTEKHQQVCREELLRLAPLKKLIWV